MICDICWCRHRCTFACVRAHVHMHVKQKQKSKHVCPHLRPTRVQTGEGLAAIYSLPLFVCIVYEYIICARLPFVFLLLAHIFSVSRSNSDVNLQRCYENYRRIRCECLRSSCILLLFCFVCKERPIKRNVKGHVEWNFTKRMKNFLKYSQFNVVFGRFEIVDSEASDFFSKKKCKVASNNEKL